MQPSPLHELRESSVEYCWVLQPMSPVMVQVLTPSTRLDRSEYHTPPMPGLVTTLRFHWLRLSS